MEKRELKIVTFIKEHGLAKAINTFKLKCKVYEHKILLKYDQIESPMGFEETQECRGLILEKDTWKVLNYAFSKFFNSEETLAAKIDWKTAKILKKEDGSLISLYFDWNKEEWCVSTTGMAEAEGEVNNRPGTTFAELFWETIEKVCGEDLKWFKAKLVKDYVYMFELTTPYNIVVTPHAESTMKLLTIRKLTDLEEFDYDTVKSIGEQYLYVPVIKQFDFNISDVSTLKRTFDGMPFTEEGYVVVDAHFNRIKVKNPSYLAVHHLKGKLGAHNIMEVVKSNEIEEFASTFPERKEEIFKLKAGYDALLAKLEEGWEILKLRLPKNITKQESKKYAMAVFEVCEKLNLKNFTGMYFGLKDKKVDTVKEFLFDYSNRDLYKRLSK